MRSQERSCSWKSRSRHSAKESDAGSKARLANLEKELSQLKDESNTMRAQWEGEKKAISEVKVIKQQIESVKHDIEDAERNYDLEKLAQLKYGTLPDLEKKLEDREGRRQMRVRNAQSPERRSRRRRNRRSNLRLDRYTGKQAGGERDGKSC